MSSTACAMLIEAKAGLTGAVTMMSASEISSLLRPKRSRPNRMAMRSPLAMRARMSWPACSGVITSLIMSRGRAVVA
jgi:hypothetical protein